MNQTPLFHYFSGFVQDGKIFSQNYEGTQQIGVSIAIHNELDKQFNELTEITEKYKTRLIELGEIDAPLTQEEIIKQQGEQLKQTQSLLLQLAKQVETITGTGTGSGNEHTSTDRKDSGVKPTNEGCSASSLSDSAGVSSKQGRTVKGVSGSKS